MTNTKVVFEESDGYNINLVARGTLQKKVISISPVSPAILGSNECNLKKVDERIVKPALGATREGG